MSNTDDKSLLICEYANDNLQVSKENDKYVLEGVFAELGVRNRNNRIYEEEQYIPQIEKLQESIQANSLLGELDHPESFDIKLKNSSHIIEKIEYDKSNRIVKGRIRLLDTDSGRQAKALVDAGVPLHISSRAAGVVENEKVKFKNLVTYDLVSTPGFKNARLHSLNESLGFDDEDNVQIFEINSNNNENKYQKSTYNMDNKGNLKYVTEEEMQKYSEYISEMFEKLRNEKENGNTENVVKYSEHIAEKLNGVIKYLDYIAEKFDESEKEKDNVKKYINMLGEKLNQNIEYTNYVSEMLDKGIQYSERIAENSGNGQVENIKKYLDYVAETFNENEKEKDQLKDFVDYMSEMLDKSIQYSEAIAEENEGIKSYSNYLAENLDNNVKYSNYLSENIDKSVKYSNYLAENMNGGKVNRSKKGIKPINENINEGKSDLESYKNNISAKIDSVITESANNKKAEFENKSGDYHFLRFLDNDKIDRFQKLNEGSQDAIVNAFRKNNYFSKRDANKIWESVTGENQEGDNKKPETFNEINKKGNLDFIQKMPKNYINEWRNSTQEVKNRIIAESTAYDLSDDNKIKSFWESRDFRTDSEKGEGGNNNSNNTQSINENNKQNVKQYSDDPRIQGIAEIMISKFNK